MLETIFGSETSAFILLNLYHYGEIHLRALARNMRKSPTAVAAQLNRLEDGGLLVSREVGRTRLYSFNKKSPYIDSVLKIIATTYEAMPIKLKEETFGERGRPRAKGKPVIKQK